eukprot:TRINITY_DN48085_c0_g1_i1.p1 TRINITY_DN48085_c0_g1~~TRINITY_DN48085_c0_g1_i1.p1  ORF type:complete len:362 (+),score=32.02 TRINITY_DN48085_c0_g1_i1:71-1156(+)
MVLSARLFQIRDMVAAGCSCRVTVSSPNPTRRKYRFIVSHGVEVIPCIITLRIIEEIEKAAAVSTSWDHGHVHSCGDVVVDFYILTPRVHREQAALATPTPPGLDGRSDGFQGPADRRGVGGHRGCREYRRAAGPEGSAGYQGSEGSAGSTFKGQVPPRGGADESSEDPQGPERHGVSAGLQDPETLDGSSTEQFDFVEFQPERHTDTASSHGSEDLLGLQVPDGLRDADRFQGREVSQGADGIQGCGRRQGSEGTQGYDFSAIVHGYPFLTDPEAQEQDYTLQNEQRARMEALYELIACGLANDRCAIGLRDALQELHEQRVALREAGATKRPRTTPLRSCLKKTSSLRLRGEAPEFVPG